MLRNPAGLIDTTQDMRIGRPKRQAGLGKSLSSLKKQPSNS